MIEPSAINFYWSSKQVGGGGFNLIPFNVKKYEMVKGIIKIHTRISFLTHKDDLNVKRGSNKRKVKIVFHWQKQLNLFSFV